MFPLATGGVTVMVCVMFENAKSRVWSASTSLKVQGEDAIVCGGPLSMETVPK